MVRFSFFFFSWHHKLTKSQTATAKGAVLNFARGLHPLLAAAGLPIRVNTLAPTWTDSSVLPGLKELGEKIEVEIRKSWDEMGLFSSFFISRS